MKNSMIVNDTAYYESSVVEKGSSLTIINHIANGEAIIKTSSFAQKQNMIYKKNQISEIIVNHINTQIINKVKEDSYNLKQLNFYIIKDDEDYFNSIQKKN